MTAINEMTPTELLIACAKQMGLKPDMICDNPDIDDNYDGWKCITCGAIGKWGEESPPYTHVVPVPYYERDRNATMELVKSIPEGKVNNFVRAIEKILFDKDLPEITLDWVYRIMTADPIVIMRAFLTVMEEK